MLDWQGLSLELSVLSLSLFFLLNLWIIVIVRWDIPFETSGWVKLHLWDREIGNTCFLSLCLQDYDPLAEHRIPKISDREDEYRARKRQMIISPERYDPFAEGQFLICSFIAHVTLLKINLIEGVLPICVVWKGHTYSCEILLWTLNMLLSVCKNSLFCLLSLSLARRNCLSLHSCGLLFYVFWISWF